MSKKDSTNNSHKPNKPKRSYWWLKVFFLTLALSAAFGLVTETILSQTADSSSTGARVARIIIASALLLIFIVINVVCDVLGTAATTCEVEPFQSMAARKMKGAKTALRILKHAEKFDNIVNDVIADICAIICGAMGVTLALEIVRPYNWDAESIYRILIFVGVSALIAALIVSVKAYLKKLSRIHSHKVVMFIARVASPFMRGDKRGGKKAKKDKKPKDRVQGAGYKAQVSDKFLVISSKL